MLGNVAVLKSFNLLTSFRQAFSKDEILELFLSLFFFLLVLQLPYLAVDRGSFSAGFVHIPD